MVLYKIESVQRKMEMVRSKMRCEADQMSNRNLLRKKKYDKKFNAYPSVQGVLTASGMAYAFDKSDTKMEAVLEYSNYKNRYAKDAEK